MYVYIYIYIDICKMLSPTKMGITSQPWRYILDPPIFFCVCIVYDTICDSWMSFHAQALDVGRTGACSRGPDSGLVSCFVLSLSLWIFLAAFFPVRPCLWTFHWTSCSLGFLCNPLSLPAFAPRASWDSACSLHRCAS